SIELDSAGTRREEAADRVEDGGLASSVRADDGTQFALRNAERYVAHGDQASEAFGGVFDFQDCHYCALTPHPCGERTPAGHAERTARPTRTTALRRTS